MIKKNRLRFQLFCFKSFRIEKEIPLEQSRPVHCPLQTHFWVSRSKSPCPEQSGRHWRASWSSWSQLRPRQPLRQTHTPSTQNPWLEQVGSEQSAKKSQSWCYLGTHHLILIWDVLNGRNTFWICIRRTKHILFLQHQGVLASRLKLVYNWHQNCIHITIWKLTTNVQKTFNMWWWKMSLEN